MSKEAHGRRGALRVLGASVAAVALFATAGCSASSDSGSGDGGDVTLEFAQWWEPELPDGAFRELMDEFEAENPGIKVELLQRSLRLDEGAARSPARPPAPCPTSSASTARG